MGRPSTPPTIVYVLEDETGAVRYVGVTANPKERLARHIREARCANTRRGTWVRSLVARGVVPVLRIVETGVDWREAEPRWIAKFRSEGCDLVNGNDGGENVPQRMLSGRPTYPHTRAMLVSLGSAVHWMRKAYANGDTTKEALDRMEASLALVHDRVRRARKRGTSHLIEARARAWAEARKGGPRAAG